VRLFVALEIPSAVRENLAALIKDLRAKEPHSEKKRVRWVRRENLHVTLNFIEETPPEKVEAICAALREVRSKEPAKLRFRGLGFFPSEKRPRVLWVGVEASPNVNALANDIDRQLEKIGIPPEQRAFTPHLTLARFEPPGISAELRSERQEMAGADFGVLCTNEFQLVQSKLQPSGAEYTVLQSFPFAVEA
jgi:RNA 2',3'-cyclic 3'-phosphodiesterase